MSRYTYAHAENGCGGNVTKKQTGTVANKTTKAGLHGWQCSSCGLKGVKVIRTLNKEQQ